MSQVRASEECFTSFPFESLKTTTQRWNLKKMALHAILLLFCATI